MFAIVTVSPIIVYFSMHLVIHLFLSCAAKVAVVAVA